MEIAPFQLERYFAKYEFSARYLLSSSDCEALSMFELLAMADTEMKRLWEGLKLGYTESWGHPLLRESIAGIYQGLEAKDVLVVVPEEGIFLFMHALLKPGDHVVCTYPGYQSLHEVARSIGCEVSAWNLDEGRGWRFDVEELASMMRANTKLVVVNFPHNPTGYVPPREDFDALIEIVREQGAYLLSDEMYRFLEVEEGVTLPAACEMYERACSLFGLSKTFGMPGLRIGWLATQDTELLKRVSRLKDYTTICSSAPSELLAIITLRNKSRLIGQQLVRLRRNIGVLDTFFMEYQDKFSWNRPMGGSICFPRMSIVENTYEFCEMLVKETGIMLAPSRAFHFGDHHVRVGFGRENLPVVIERFAAYLDQRFR
ncbi:MAG: aminotransferase class I/II-fold pyridoxal phosphate-dependent enzyme [Anaerolineales bacterium]|nr:aminotransferase class I/II-fold pyridoxal phosphate-dependent enzyme [Anaerolineales bacterium]